MKRGLPTYLGLSVILFCLYAVSAKFGLEVHAVNSFATLVWIPSGLSLAFLLIFGLRYWPAITLAAFTANYLNDAPFLAALGISVGNTLEPLVGAYLLKGVVKIRPALDRVNDVLGLVFFGAILSTMISATVGTTSLYLNDVIASSDYASTWFAWWAGDAISVLIIAPLMLVWSASKPRLSVGRRYFAELAAFLVVLIVVTELVFGSLGERFSGNRPRSYFMFPVFIWSALRFSQRVTVSALLLFSGLALWHTIYSTGPYSSGTTEQNLLTLQLYMAVLAITSMILTAAISERKVLERRKDEFISVASHELKTPITSIKTFTQTLELMFERKGDKQSSVHMSRINRQVDRLNRLVIKMLDLTRIQEGRITLQKERFVIGSLIREIVEEVSEVTHHKILVKGNTRTSVAADKDRIGRVLTNLLSNAVSYSPAADEILVRVTKKPEFLIISVQDFGKGVAEADRVKVFDRFYQSEKKNTKPSLGLGLGLYISKAIVEKHGGRIWVESKSHKSVKTAKTGSTFSFTIPLASRKTRI